MFRRRQRLTNRDQAIETGNNLSQERHAKQDKQSDMKLWRRRLLHVTFIVSIPIVFWNEIHRFVFGVRSVLWNDSNKDQLMIPVRQSSVAKFRSSLASPKASSEAKAYTAAVTATVRNNKYSTKFRWKTAKAMGIEHRAKKRGRLARQTYRMQMERSKGGQTRTTNTTESPWEWEQTGITNTTMSPRKHLKRSITDHRFPRIYPNSINISIDESIYDDGPWDSSPIVIEEYKLLFFTIPKVGCTVWKQLFRRMKGLEDWRMVGDYPNGTFRNLPHDPRFNSLSYLSYYSVDDALLMMTSPEWTRAMFLRDPKDRILSAYFDKAERNQSNPLLQRQRQQQQFAVYVSDPQNVKNTFDKLINKSMRRKEPSRRDSYVIRYCCPTLKRCGQMVENSFVNFIHLAYNCHDPHWASQSKRIEAQYWPYINFVGHLETAQVDAKRLLQQIGAWELFGASGWGKKDNRTDDKAIFASTSSVLHSTGAREKRNQYYTAEAHRLVELLYADDYQNPLFNFSL